LSRCRISTAHVVAQLGLSGRCRGCADTHAIPSPTSLPSSLRQSPSLLCHRRSASGGRATPRASPRRFTAPALRRRVPRARPAAARRASWRLRQAAPAPGAAMKEPPAKPARVSALDDQALLVAPTAKARVTRLFPVHFRHAPNNNPAAASATAPGRCIAPPAQPTTPVSCPLRPSRPSGAPGSNDHPCAARSLLPLHHFVVGAPQVCVPSRKGLGLAFAEAWRARTSAPCAELNPASRPAYPFQRLRNAYLTPLTRRRRHVRSRPALSIRTAVDHSGGLPVRPTPRFGNLAATEAAVFGRRPRLGSAAHLPRLVPGEHSSTTSPRRARPDPGPRRHPAAEGRPSSQLAPGQRRARRPRVRWARHPRKTRQQLAMQTSRPVTRWDQRLRSGSTRDGVPSPEDEKASCRFRREPAPRPRLFNPKPGRPVNDHDRSEPSAGCGERARGARRRGHRCWTRARLGASAGGAPSSAPQPSRLHFKMSHHYRPLQKGVVSLDDSCPILNGINWAGASSTTPTSSTASPLRAGLR